MAQQEKWFLGKSPDPDNPHPILGNYIKYTYYRLMMEGKIVERTRYAAFHTGLADHLDYRPIYALFETNNVPNKQRWRFRSFCIPGEGSEGKLFARVFGSSLPERASYITKFHHAFFDGSKRYVPNTRHIIEDGIVKNRFPYEFLQRHSPDKFELEDYRRMDNDARKDHLKAFVRALQEDKSCRTDIRARIEEATDLAMKRATWNFRTPVPQYYPTFDKVCHLLPIALVDRDNVDAALVISSILSAEEPDVIEAYQVETIFSLPLAYNNARLICRPESEWLTPEAIHADPSDLQDDEDSTD